MTVFMVFIEANKTAANCTIVPASVTAPKHIVLDNGGDMHVGLSSCLALCSGTPQCTVYKVGNNVTSCLQTHNHQTYVNHV